MTFETPRRYRFHFICCIFLIVVFVLQACSPEDSAVVVVYTSVDQPHAEPVLLAFEEHTGIVVQAVYDLEAAKTTGLVNRLIAEKNAPQADVFWNSEILQTLRLKEAGVLAKYQSPEAGVLPDIFRDPEGYWTGVGGRARVWVINTDLVEDSNLIAELEDLLDPAWDGRQKAIAYPLFGTTATHSAVLYTIWGPERTRSFFQQLAENDVRIVDGNSVVRDLVASGVVAFGLTDTDDACAAVESGASVKVVLPDQDQAGTLLIPGTVALVQGAPHPKEARLLIDYLLSAQTAQDLVDSGFNHLPIHPDAEAAQACLGTNDIHLMQVDFSEVYSIFEQSQSELREIFIK